MDQHTTQDDGSGKDSRLIDIATRDVICLATTSLIGEAAAVMRERRISSIVVEDGGGRPVGIVTERNILRAMLSGTPLDVGLSDIMSSPVITVAASITVLDAHHLCQNRHIRHLVIVDENDALVGVVSETNFRLHLNLAALAGRRKIASLAKRMVISLPPSTNLRQALDLMLAQHKSCVVAIEDEKPVGIVTERDVVKFYAGEKQYDEVRLGEAMVSPVQTIPHDATISQAAEEMLAHKLRHLIVVDEAGRMVGLVSEHDLTQVMTASLTEERDGIEDNFLRTLINTLPDLVWLKDTEGVFLACNARFEQLYGAKEADIVGKTDYDFVERELADFFRQYDRKAMEVDRSSINEEWLTFAADGYRGLFETIKTPMRDRNGKLIGVLGVAREITGHTRLKDKLERNEQKLQDIYDSVDDSIEIISLDGIILDMNRAGCKRQGYTYEELVGHRLADFTSPEYAPRIPEFSARIKVQGRATFESARRHKNGTFIPLEVNSRLIELDGQPVFLSISRDITERKRMEQQLDDYRKQLEGQVVEESTKFKALVEQSLVGIYIIQDNRLSYVNSGFASIFGYHSAAGLIDRVVPDQLAVPEDRAKIRENMRRHPSGEADGFHYSFRGLKRDGTVNVVEVYGRKIDYQGKPAVIGTLVDVTEERRSHEELARLAEEKATELTQKEHIYSAIFGQTDSGIDLIDPDTLRYVEVNDAACRMMGYSREEFMDMRLVDIQADSNEGQVRGRIEQMSKKNNQRFEARHRRKDGTVLDVEVNATLVDLGGRSMIVGVWNDVTERKLNEAERRRLSTALMQSGEPVSLTNVEIRYVYANPAFCKLFGYRLDELKGRSASLLTPTEKAPGLTVQQTAAVARDHGGFRGEVWRRAKDGRLVPIMLRISPMHEEQGKLTGYVATMTDLTEVKQMESALRENEKHFRGLFEHAPIGMVTTSLDGWITMVNEAFCNMLGRKRDEFEKLTYMDISHPEDREIANPYRQRLLDGEIETYQLEKRLLHKDGHIVWGLITSSLERDYSGKPLYFIAQMEDITQRKQDEENLRVNASVFNASQEAIVITDAENAFIDVNPAFTRITGYSREEALGKNPRLLNSGHHDKAFFEAMWNTLKEQGSWRGEIWNRRKSGEIYPEMLSINIIYDTEGRAQRYVGVFSDISLIKQHEAELSQVAHYDALTGIPNRVLLADRMHQAIARTARKQEMMAVCYLDLDGFKQINDSLGHDAGDQVLIEIAKRITGIIRAGDTVARLGGDEFVILLLGLNKTEECAGTLNRLLSSIDQPIRLGRNTTSITTSIGVSIYPLDNEDVDTLLRHADQAMYRAKQAGKHRYHIYDPSPGQLALDIDVGEQEV